MMQSFSAWRSALLAGIATTGVGFAGVAHAQTAAVGEVAANDSRNHVSNYVDISGSVGIASNPRLEAGSGSNITGLGRISAYAVHSIVTERNAFDLTGYVENQSYTNGIASTQSFSLAASARRTQSERLTLYGNANFSGDTGGQLYNRFVSLPSSPPVVDTSNPLPPVVIIDPNEVALNRRTFRLSAQGGFGYRFSARDSIDGSLGYDHTFFTGGGPKLDYSTVSGSLGWQRQISERTSGGARVLVSRSDYGSRGNSYVVTPQLTVNTQLAEGWSANAAVGASFANESLGGLKDHSVGLSLDAGLCRTTLNESFCGHVARGSQTAIGLGLTTATTASASYFRRLDAKNTVQASLSVSRSSPGDRLITLPATTFYAGNVSYNRKINARLSGGVEAGAHKYTQTGLHVPISADATIFIRYRLGDLQ